jgi:hypothetical protein
MKTDTDELIDAFFAIVCCGFLMGAILGYFVGLVDAGPRTAKETINLYLVNSFSHCLG